MLFYSCEQRSLYYNYALGLAMYFCGRTQALHIGRPEFNPWLMYMWLQMVHVCIAHLCLLLHIHLSMSTINPKMRSYPIAYLRRTLKF